MDRRAFIAAAIGTIGVGLASCAAAPGPRVASSVAPSLQATLEPLPAATPQPLLLPFDESLPKFPLPAGPVTALPSTSNLMAWTVDDGWGEEVVQKYATFANDFGARLTFFICAGAPGWTSSAAVLRPLVEARQVQIANHTYSHPKLTSLSDTEIQADLMRNHDLIKEIYGVDARPYYRPPFGYRDERTDRAAAAIGYTVPVLWHGSLSDSGEITTQQVLEFADKWFLPEHIVIGHANYPAVTEVFPQLVDMLNQRKLITVTLNDVFKSA